MEFSVSPCSCGLLGTRTGVWGKVLWVGALTLSLLVLPIIVIAAREALRAVPSSIRQAALALGATKWQVVRDHVLPSAIPGILTGTILALSRAIGETAPLLMVGAIGSMDYLPNGPTSRYSALPVQIYKYADEAKPAFRPGGRGRHSDLARDFADDEFRRDRDSQPLSDTLAMKPEIELPIEPHATAGVPMAPKHEAKTMSAGDLPKSAPDAAEPPVDIVLSANNLSVWYGTSLALREVSIEIPRKKITALIGPSGCGKSTLLRCFNRMNDLIPGARMDGEILFDGMDLTAPGTDAVALRRRIGMVFQKPNPFPKSIYQNVAWGARINGYRGDMDELVEKSLKRAALWDEVKNNLNRPGLDLSGGQQQRLCIARTLAVEPEVILMDEPCSALDPIATAKVENLMDELKADYTIRNRHAQHAAGPPHQRHDGLPDARRFGPAERPSHWDYRRIQPHGTPLHQPARPSHRGLHHGTDRVERARKCLREPARHIHRTFIRP